MEERPPQSIAKAGNAASPSVAQLAGRFREQAAATATKETAASKPTRRKPPCSLPLFPPKLELGQNGEEKSSPSVNHGPKVKVKSSPLIEKLQATLAFDPMVLLPGASPKSPGLKTAVSPFQSPPSTPSSPGVWSRASDPEEVPVSFDEPPPEGSHLPCFNKVRTRGSIKRRPPSRRFRRSQSDFGDLANFRVPEPAQENGAKEENGDVVFPTTAGSLDEGLGRPEAREKVGSLEEPPLRRTPSRTEKPEGKVTTPNTQLPQPAEEGPREEAAEAPETPSPGAENGCGGPTEAEQPEEAAEAQEEDEAPPQRCEDEGAVHEKGPPNPPGGREGGPSPEQGKSEEKQEEGSSLEPGQSPCQPEASREAPETEDHSPAKDTEM